MKKFFITLVLLAGMIILWSEVIYVPEDFGTIQAAIDASGNGDEIIVSPGTYYENINFNGKAVTVASLYYTTQDTSYISQTVIDGNQNGSVVRFVNGECNNSVLKGFTITNGFAQGESLSGCGGGIFCLNGSSPTLSNLRVLNNSAEYQGGGIFCRSNSNPIIVHSLISGNYALYGGGIRIVYNCFPIFKNLKIQNNSAEFEGGGIFCSANSELTLVNILISTNYADIGAGIYCVSLYGMTLNRVTISDNVSSENGGGIHCQSSSDIVLVNSLLWNNEPEQISFHHNGEPVSMTIAYSDIEGGQESIVTHDHGTLNWLEGNMDCVPLFAVQPQGDYNLAIESPCINTGTSFFQYNNEIIVNLDESSYFGCAPEMGYIDYEETELYARFLSSTCQGCAPLEVEFSDISSGNATSWYWDFDNDGVVDSYEQNPVYLYEEMGIFSVSLEVRNDDNGELSTELKEDFIHVLTPNVLNMNTGIWYPTIQQAITVSENGDLIIVNPGIYDENITFLGKAITLGSYFYSTQDTSYISQTIIHPHNHGHAVTFNNMEGLASVLTGFTISGGVAVNGGGIYCLNSSPTLSNLIITGNQAYDGAGIYCYLGCNPIIHNVNILNNYAGYSGGGISLSYFCFPVITNAIISDNQAYNGGGCYFKQASDCSITSLKVCSNYAINLGGGLYIDSDPTLIDVWVEGNQAGNKGGGIYCEDYGQPQFENVTVTNNASEYGGGLYLSDESFPQLHSQNRCSIYLNNANHRNQGGDLYSERFMSIVVDTFTVINPTNYHAYPIENFTFDILQAYNEQINSDLYVSPEGANANSGLSPDFPLKTIQHACSIIEVLDEQLTIHLAEGIYSPSSNGDRFPIVLPLGVNLIGESVDSVILDAENTAGVMTFEDTDSVFVSNIQITGGLNEKGGGLKCLNSSVTLANSIVQSNKADFGGGIYCYESNLMIENVTIRHNEANLFGGGIMQEYNSYLEFSQDNRCNIYENNIENRGIASEIYSSGCCPVVVDTFTVLHPSTYHVIQYGVHFFDILNSIQQQVNSDLYVSPSGDNCNSGLSADDAFKTIQHASSVIMASEAEPHVIHLASGVYSHTANDEFFPITLPSYVSLIGEDMDSVILDAENLSGVIRLYHENGIVISGVTITNGLAEKGGGLYSQQCDTQLEKVRIINNTATESGGGAYFDSGNPVLYKVLVSDNTSEREGGGIFYKDGHMLKLFNVTLTNNHAQTGGGVYCEYVWIVSINSILWGNYPETILNPGIGIQFPFIVANTIIEGGIEAYFCEVTPIFELGGMLNCDPGFIDPENGNYHLHINSSSINAGTDYLEVPAGFAFHEGYIFEIGSEEYYDSAPDLGAFEYTESIDIDENLLLYGRSFINYPNPFNPETKIAFNLPEEGEVKLEIYNLKGQLVEKLLTEKMAAGEHSLIWSGQRAGSGIYLLRLQAGNLQQIRKIVMVK